MGGDKVNLRISGPEVVPPFEQLQPVKSGVLIFCSPMAFIMSVQKALLPLLTLDCGPSRETVFWVWDSLDKFYQKTHSLKLLAISPSSTAGYHIFLKDPIKGGSWDGRKIRGTQTYHGVIKLFGGEPVVMPGSQVYSALEKGVVDGAAWPAAGMLSMKHFEVAKYKVRPTF